MSPHIEALFHTLADLAPGERDAYFARHGIDETTRREVEQLLDFDGRGGLTGEVSSAAAEAMSELDTGGLRCGPFVLKQVIGRGGMGVVYLAEREDGEVSQRAAVKLLQPGLGGHQHEFFLQERQILAELSHPNIAHLLDAGRRQDGQPYLAMEYVEGRRIDEFATGIGVRETVRLFLKVCGAVAYMHRNLVVHRDLKPGNILVTGNGEPKLLDFGIAKFVDLAADATVSSVRMMTPGFASPEQMLGDRVGTPSDIYSLGAVLYFLLTGATPRPAASGSVTAKQATQGAVTRPSLHAPALRGDLDAILLKTLRFEPHERYGSVEQLMEDLEAFLDWRPVRARQGEVLYHARRFVRRYWVPVAAAAVAVGGLAVGIVIANRERAIAQRRFDDVRQLSNRLFDIDANVRGLPGATRTRQLIVDTSLEYLQRLAADAASDPGLALDVGTAFLRVGRVQGVPISTHLGQPEEAEKNLQKAEALIASVLKAEPGNRTAAMRAAMIAHDRMVLAQARRPYTAAMPLARESHRWLDKYLSSGPVEDTEKMQVVITGMNVANWYGRNGDHDAAVSLLRPIIRIARETGQPNQAGAALIVLTRTQRDRGDLDGALASISEAAELLKPGPALAGDTTRIRAYVLVLLEKGETLGTHSGVSFEKFAEAIPYYRETFDSLRELAGRDPADAGSRLTIGTTAIRLGPVLARTDPAAALTVMDEAIRLTREIKSNSRARRQESRLLSLTVDPLLKLGRRGDAARNMGAAFRLLAELKLYPAPTVEMGWEADDALRARASLELATGDAARAVQTLEGLLQAIEATEPKPETELLDATDLSPLYLQMADAYAGAGNADAARRMRERRRDIWRKLDARNPGNQFIRLQIERDDRVVR